MPKHKMKNPHISKSGADFGKGPMVIKIEYNEIYNIIKTTVLYSLKSKHFECFNEQTAYSNTIQFVSKWLIYQNYFKSYTRVLA